MAALRMVLSGLLVIPAVMAIAACQSAATGPIVYTAPPDVFARTFPPAASASAESSAVAPSQTRDDSSSPVDQLPTEPPASVGPGGSAPGASGSQGHPGPGMILFGTAAGSDSCSVTNPTNVLLSSQPFFFAARLAEQMDGTKAIVLSIVKDGVPIVNHEEPADGRPFNCYGNTQSLGTLQPGAYDFEVKQGTTVEAKGFVTVQ